MAGQVNQDNLLILPLNRRGTSGPSDCLRDRKADTILPRADRFE